MAQDSYNPYVSSRAKINDTPNTHKVMFYLKMDDDESIIMEARIGSSSYVAKVGDTKVTFEAV